MPLATKGFFSPTASAAPASPALQLVPRCSICRLFENCISPKMEVSGEGRRGILVIGGEPDKRDDEDGSQFVGKAGDLLRRHLRSAGVDLDRDCWKTNALICHPDNATPTDLQIDYCRPNLTKTLRDLNPTVIIPLGGSAIKSLIPPLWKMPISEIGEIGRWVGLQIPDGTLNSWIAPSWHPSYILRTGEEQLISLWFGRHLVAAVNLDERPWPESGRPNYAADVQVIMDPDEAAVKLAWEIPKDHGILAFDFETDRLKPDHKDSWIVCCSIAWGDGPEPHTVLSYPWTRATADATKDLIMSGLPKIAANLQFEQRWLIEEFGRGAVNWRWDTMQVAHILDNRHDITGLKFQAYTRLGQPDYASHIQPFLESKGTNTPNRIKEVPMPQLLKYCGLDSALEYRLAWLQAAELGVKLI